MHCHYFQFLAFSKPIMQCQYFQFFSFLQSNHALSVFPILSFFQTNHALSVFPLLQLSPNQSCNVSISNSSAFSKPVKYLEGSSCYLRNKKQSAPFNIVYQIAPLKTAFKNINSVSLNIDLT